MTALFSMAGGPQAANRLMRRDQDKPAASAPVQAAQAKPRARGSIRPGLGGRVNYTPERSSLAVKTLLGGPS